MPGALARWLHRGEKVEVRFLEEPERVNRVYVAPRDSYELRRIWGSEQREERVKSLASVEARSWARAGEFPRGKVYEYRVVAARPSRRMIFERS